MKCKWYAEFEGVCTNGECPYRGDACPTSEHPEVCKYAGNKYEVSELVKILRCGAGDEHKCADCAANLKNKCDRKEANQQAADMLENLAAEKDTKKPEWIDRQRTAISAIETCRQLKKSLFGKENVTNKELASLVLQLKSEKCKDREGAETEEER